MEEEVDAEIVMKPFSSFHPELHIRGYNTEGQVPERSTVKR